MCHAVLWAAQVRAVSSSRAREEPARLLPSAEARSKLLRVPLLASQRFSAHPSCPSSARSFCCEHRPQQAVEAAPEQDTNCTICLEPVGDKKSYHTMVCPVCTQAWFHRSCIQVGALPLLCSHSRCSAAPGPTHTLAARVTAAGTGHERWHSALPMSRLRRQDAIPERNAPSRDPNPSQVGAFCPALQIVRRKCCACPGIAPSRPS